MANWGARLLLFVRFCCLASATAALAVYSYASSSHSVHATAVQSCHLALSGLAAGYAALLVVQAGIMFLGWEVPLPDSLVQCFVVMAIDWVLAIVTFGTACSAVSVVQISAQWHVFVHYVEVPYMVYSALALVSGMLASLTCVWETFLAMEHRMVPRWVLQQH